MRRSIEKLARLLRTERDSNITMGALATKYNEPVERIMDALDVCKILSLTGAVAGGPYTYIEVE